MAVSNGYFTTNNYQGRYLQFEWNIVEQNIAENYTLINWRWYGNGKASSSWYYLYNSYLNVYGTRRYTQGGAIQLYEGTTLAQGNWNVGNQIKIYHDNNGNGSFSADGGGGIYTNSVNCTGRGTWELPQIPRQANITNCDNWNDEQNPSFTYNNPLGENAESLDTCISLTGAKDDISYRAISKTGTDYSYNLTEDEKNILRKACTENSLQVKIFLRTKIGNQYFYSIVTRVVNIVNGNPTFSNFTFADTNSTTIALTGNSAYNINGYSNIKAIISTANKATANKYATMSKYRFAIGDKSVDIDYSDTSDVGGTINGTQNGTYNMYAIDSRGNSTLVTKLASKVIEYTPLIINTNQVSVIRSNNGSGTDCTLKFSGTFWNSSFGKVTNTIKSVTYQLKKTTSSTWVNGTTAITPTTSGNTFSFEGLIRSDNTDYSWNLGDSYDVKITINDQLSSKTVQATLISAKPNLALAKGGVAVNQAYNETLGGNLQVGGGNVYGATVLYQNDSGMNGTITLSDSAANYSYLEFFYRNHNNYMMFNSTKVCNPNSKKASLEVFHTFANGSNTSVADNKSITIKDNTISTVGGEEYGRWWSWNNENYYENQIYIHKILGYK